MNPSNKLTRSLFFISVVPFYFADAEILLHGLHLQRLLSGIFAGMAGLFSCGAAISWLANPLLIVSWFTIRRNQSFRCWWLFWLFYSPDLSCCLIRYWPMKLVICKTITEYRFGFWLWLGSTPPCWHAHLLPFTCWTWKRQKLLSQKQDYR